MPPSSSLSPLAMPPVCHLPSHFSDLFMKYVCTTPLCNGCREGWIVTRLISSLSNLFGPTATHRIGFGVSGLIFNLNSVGFKPGLCREFSGGGKASQGSSISLGGWGLSAQVLAGGGVRFGLHAQVQLSQRGTLFVKLWTVISLSKECLAWREHWGSMSQSPHLSLAAASRPLPSGFSPFSPLRVKAWLCCN